MMQLRYYIYVTYEYQIETGLFASLIVTTAVLVLLRLGLSILPNENMISSAYGVCFFQCMSVSFSAP